MAWNKLSYVATRCALVVTAGFLMAPTCGNEITVASRDSSPPEVGFALDTGDGPKVVSGTVTLPYGKSYTVSAWGIDPQTATSRIEYSAGSSHYCEWSDGIATQSSGLSAVDSQTQTTRVGSKAQSGLYEDFSGTMSPPTICEGSVKGSLSRSFRLTAFNGLGQQTRGSFTLRMTYERSTPPPPPPPGEVCDGATERCCDPGPGNTCYQCFPKTMQCP